MVLAGVFAFSYQVYHGLGVWGLNWPVFWAFDITNFVFWIGISHAGTLISAILRLANAGWRRPVTRCAEAITVFALSIGAIIPICHLGRPWLFFWLVPYPSERHIWPNFRSPLLWDFFAILTYLTGSMIFLFLPIIPDAAAARDLAHGWRKKLYALLSLGWQGNPKQWHRLESAMHIMAIAIIPVAVSVHTIVSWDFAMTPVPMWHSTIFGPYFVCGAIFSGVAALILAMALLRKFLHLEEYLEPIHFDHLGKLLLTMSLLWFYFTFAERLTTWYGNDVAEMSVFWTSIRQNFAPLFWTMVTCNLIIPFPLLAIKRFRTITGTVIASSYYRRRHVDRALSDYRAHARTQVSSLCLGELSSDLGGDHAHGCGLRHDGAALSALLEARAHDLDVGTRGGRSQSAHLSPPRGGF